MLAKAMRINYSVVVLSLRIRNLMERQQISKYVVRNVEFIRQARQRYFKATGQQRERNQVEKYFDRIAQNDPTIQEVSMVGNKRFLTLTSDEKVRAAQSFGDNTHARTVNLTACGIDDEFVIALASSLQRNKAIERLYLEGNDISGDGITALFEALAKNTCVEELRLHKQSKLLNTSDEHLLADILEPNTTITKLGIDLRTTMAQVAIDRKLTLNRNLSLKLRAESKGISDFAPSESFTTLKF
jgi:leiomodin